MSIPIRARDKMPSFDCDKRDTDRNRKERLSTEFELFYQTEHRHRHKHSWSWLLLANVRSHQGNVAKTLSI